MKIVYSLFIIQLFCIPFLNAQAVSGEITIGANRSIEVALENNKAVNFYAACRQGKYPIHFIFKGDGLIPNSEKQEVVMFTFSTTIKRDGKTLNRVDRAPIPFFPGDMFMPIETFDIISLLSSLQSNTADKISEIPKGKYELELKAIPLNVKGEIQSAKMYLSVY